ncbi:SPFH domain-containing protein [Streptomyces sp. NRRL F-5727]|uniref:SPFH domain-containing protein n=1 Tax=Streptomyces sp. NRRL F-5727 TaxID=1463871 RepID=UPI00099D75F5|nr:SPFH domain-containing protein [Streptomyces sp. NRRL F-5727]
MPPGPRPTPTVADTPGHPRPAAPAEETPPPPAPTLTADASGTTPAPEPRRTPAPAPDAPPAPAPTGEAAPAPDAPWVAPRPDAARPTPSGVASPLGVPAADGSAPATVRPEPEPEPEPEAGAAARTPVGSASAARLAGTAQPARTTDTAPANDPAPVPDTASGDAAAAGSSDLPGAVGVGVFKEERDVLDFGRITGGKVASVAVPVAAVGRLPRRKNVIGAETTGSIPVHLLFRDGGDTPGTAAATDDDGGPDTVAMAPPAVRAARAAQPAKAAQAAIPRPAKPARTASARPAPTADPALVERAAAVLPGWVGVAGGLLALAGCAAVVWWAGVVPAEAARMLRLPPRPYHGVHLAQWALLALGVLVLLFAVGGLGRGRVGYAWVLTLFGEYRGTVRRTGLVWASPLLLRRRVDVRLRHWRSEPLPAVDAKGTALDVTVLVVWRVRDTVRAALGVDGHEDYLREQVEAAMARVLSQLPADAFHEDAPTLRDAEAVGEALTRMLSAECAPVGLDVFSAQPTRIEYAPEVAEAMRRRRIAAIDAKHRDSVLTSVVDAVDDVVHRLTSRGLVELDDYERKALVKDLTVAFYTGRGGPGEGA